jgi:hypothetical protein
LGQDCAESTTKAYAESLALYLRWCERSERDWRTGAERLGAFVTWLKHTPSNPEALWSPDHSVAQGRWFGHRAPAPALPRIRVGR